VRVFGELGASGRDIYCAVVNFRTARHEVPHIHSATSPKTLHFRAADAHIHSASSPKTLRKNPISTAEREPNSLSRNDFRPNQLFNSSRLFLQNLKAPADAVPLE
jgi:hypothetical protein